MKALLYSILLVICLNTSSSQTILKPLPLSSYSYGGRTINFDDTTVWAPRVQKHFMLGWQWAGPNTNTNKRLHCNFYQHGYGLNSTMRDYFAHIPDSGGIKYIVWLHLQTPGGSPGFWAMGNQMGFQFDPTGWTTMDLHNPIRTGDTTGAVFGFKVRDSVYGHLNSSGANFDRYSLDTLLAGFTDSMKYAGVVVLDKPVIDDHYYQYADASTADDKYRQLGRLWYVSINLRRTDSTDILMNNDTLLTISIPYVLQDTTVKDTIIFDSIAVDTVGLAASLLHGRGIVLPLRPTPYTADSTRLVITRKMLPKGNATDRDITISAFFRFKSLADSVTPPNTWLKKGGAPFGTIEIDKLGITARYHGRGKVSIDWIRIGTPELESELRGEKDSIIWSYTDHNIQIMRDTIAGDTGHVARSKFRLLSFYGRDEAPLENYLSMRYYSALMDGRFTTEGPAYTLERTALNFDTFWSGGLGCLIQPSIPTPILKDAYPKNKYRLFLKTGYDFRPFHVPGYNWASDGSSYETRIGEDPPIKRSFSGSPNYFKNSNPLVIFNTTVGGNPGTLGAYELFAYYFNKDYSLFYSGKPWWCNKWGTSGLLYTYYPNDINRDYQYINIKPLTGEEMRLQIWTSLIHGAKGLMYDRMYSSTVKLKIDTIIHTDHIPVDTSFMCDTCSGQYGIQKDFFQTGMMYDPSQVPDTLTGDNLINSDEAGPDFIWPGDKTRLDLIFNLNKMADSMGVPHGRVYIGRKSMRREVMKAHDFIYDHDQLLMSMRLVTWFGKGFYFYQTGDTALFSRYIVSDPDKFKVRPPTRTYYDSTAGKQLPYYEDPDSTFFDLTIHKVGDTPLDSTFILCALNRRTAPFLMEHDSASGKDTIIRFVTTAEFDSIVAGNPSKKYAQSGAREITIPFNYHDTLGYALLRIRELGGGIDTVIGQDRALAIKFLPGEGKMFKVEILHPDTTLAGNLSYTNQRKLVGFPKLGDSDSMYYHLTYHKPIPGSSPSRSAVYYRRSEAMRTNSSTQNIIWQKEIRVSKNIRSIKGENDTIVNSNCAYPSLVVRYDDSSGVNKVYIVYACVDDDTCFYSTKKRIVESIIRADDSSQASFIPLISETLSKFHGSLDEYGTPMINASDSGNYYCWADSLLGIVVGWKHVDSTYLEDTKNISYNLTIGELPKVCKHPSLNSYSRLKLGENDCALVWQEKFWNTEGYLLSKILYTRLKVIGSKLISYLSPNLTVANGVQVIDAMGTIAQISPPEIHPLYGNHHLPSVYREIVDTFSSSANNQRDIHADIIGWHAYDQNSNYSSPVYRRFLGVFDSSGIPDRWWSDGLTKISKTNAYLENVSLSQGDADIQQMSDSLIGNYSDRSIVMTFTESTVNTDSMIPPFYNKLWQVQSGLVVAPSFQELPDLETDSEAFVIDPTGKTGQTAALPSVRAKTDWRKNRRVYEGKLADSLPLIKESAQYFFKTSSKVETNVFTGFWDGASKYLLSNPILNGKIMNLEHVKRLRGERGKFGGRHGFTDTLETNWFTVGDAANLFLKSIGKNAGLVSAFIERRSDGERFAVQLRTSDDTTALWTRIPLLRGGVEEYRFYMVKNSVGRGEEVFTIPDYGEEMVLGEMKTSISFNKSNNDIQTIDLGRDSGAQASIRVFPNPAQDKVSVVVLGNNPKDVWHIKVMNVLGHVMSEHDDKTSSLLEIVTEDYPSGVYYITAESGRLNATARFVIMIPK